MLRRIDPLGPLLAILGAAVFLIHGFNGRLARDLALYAYSGEQLANGVPPYESVLNRAGPLAHLVPGIGSILADWFGKDDVLTQRFVMMLLSMATVWVVYLIARDLYRSKPAGVIAATTLLTIQGFMIYATGGPREKTTMMLMMALALWAILHERWGWAGAFVALATLTWQPAFFFGFVVALAAVRYRRDRSPLRSVGWICLGGAIPTALTILGFALAGALKPLIDGFLLINMRYTKQSGVIGFFRDNAGALGQGYGASLWVVVLGLVATLVIAVVLLVRRADLDDPRTRFQVAAGIGLVAAAVAALKTLNGWPDTLDLVPTAVISFAGVLHWLAARTPKPAVLAAAYGVVALVLAGLNAAATSSDALLAQRAAVSAAFRIAGHDATVASVAAPAPLVLAHKTNPVPYQMFKNGFDGYVDDTYPGGLKGLAQHLDDLHPTFITLDSQATYRWIMPVLERDYVRVGRTADVAWWVRRDVDPTTITRLRAGIQGHRPKGAD